MASGSPSAALALNLLGPTAIDVSVREASGATTSYAVVVPPVQEAFIKASNTRQESHFGYRLAFDGDTLAVGAYEESSGATGINGDQDNTSQPNAGAVYIFIRDGTNWAQQAYLKASNARANAEFGVAVALSGDTLAVGSDNESSSATGVGGNQANTGADKSGAVYIFTRSGTTWSQQAYIKASNTRADAYFGEKLALAGNTLAVGSDSETSNASGINGNQADTSTKNAGAAYVFVRTGATWSQQAYIKASNARAEAFFGDGIALEGTTLVVGSSGESSRATGIGGNQADASFPFSGAAYVFTRSGVTWSQQAYVKASDARTLAKFGQALSLSGDTLAVGAFGEPSRATGVNGNQNDTSAQNAGAAYVFTRDGTTWAQQAYIKASNTRANAFFGSAVAVLGETLVVGSGADLGSESSNATGINGNEADTSARAAGAAYLFTRRTNTWSQQAYIKASNTRPDVLFGCALALSNDTLVIGAAHEASGAKGINGTQADASQPFAGAVYVFR